jgi:hypothetical protein
MGRIVNGLMMAELVEMEKRIDDDKDEGIEILCCVGLCVADSVYSDSNANRLDASTRGQFLDIDGRLTGYLGRFEWARLVLIDVKLNIKLINRSPASNVFND